MPNTVQVIPSHGKFTVRVVENGETSEKDFDIESHARSWASGQTMRLIKPSSDETHVPSDNGSERHTASPFTGDKIG